MLWNAFGNGVERCDAFCVQYFGLAGEFAMYDKHFKSLRVVGLTDAITFFRALWVWRYNFKKSTNSQDVRKVGL